MIKRNSTSPLNTMRDLLLYAMQWHPLLKTPTFHGAHPKRTLQLRSFRVRLVDGTGVQDRSRRSHRRVNSAAWSFTKSAMLVGVSPVSLR
jgi:hypothetical protein